MRAAALVAPLFLAACEGGEQGGNAPVAAKPVAYDQGGRLIDLAGVLAPAEEQALARRLRSKQQADGRPVIVVLVEPAESSLEQLGWAVGSRAADGPLLLLVDPTSRNVRIEGNFSLVGKARVAAAMQPALGERRYADAVDAALTELERLAP